MSTKSDLKVLLGVDGEAEFSRKMNALAKQQREIRDQINLANSALGVNASAYDKAKVAAEGLTKQIELQKNRISELEANYQKAKTEQGELSKTTIDLKHDYDSAQIKLNDMKNQLEEANKVIAAHENKFRQATDAVEHYGDRVNNIGGKVENVGNTLSKKLTVPIVTAGVAAAKSAIDFESAFAGVRKTVDATEEEYKAMSDATLDLSTQLATSATEIATVEEAAGQLGISKENIVEFTKVMIGLGMSTNISAEDAASALAKIANITNMPADKYEALGNVIVALGNNFATTESDIVNMTTRLAATGQVVGYTQPQMFAIATALSSVGIEAEAGGSAFSKLSKDLNLAVAQGGSDLEKWAEVAGVSASEFKKAYEEDALGALNMFIRGLSDRERLGKDAIQVLADMGMTESRLSNTVLSLASSEDILGQALKIANAQWEGGNALQDETGKRLETTESKLQNAKNELTKTAVILGDNFLPIIQDVAKKVGEVAERFGELDPKTQQAIVKFGMIAAAAGPTISVLGKVTSGIGNITSTGVKAIRLFSDIKTGTYTGPLKELVGALSTTSSATSGLTGASTTLATTVGMGGPLLIAFAAAAAVAGGLYLAYRKSTEGTRALGEEIENICSKFGNLDQEVEQATNLLTKMSDNVIGIDEEKQAQTAQSLENIQKQITEIARLRTEQRRELTQKEIDRLNELFAKMGELSQAELDMMSQKQDAVKVMAEHTDNMTKQEAEDLIKSATDTKDEVISLAKQQYEEKILLAQQAFEQDKSITQEQFEQKVADAAAEKQQAIDAANQKYGDTYAVITNAFYDEELATDEHIQKINALNEQKAQKETELDELTKQQGFESSLYLKIKAMKLGHQIDDINGQIADSYGKVNQDTLASWMEMSMNTELYGGKISEESRITADNFIDNFDDLPKKTKEAFQNAMQGALDGLKEKQEDLFNKASNVAGSFINKIKTKFDEHSPSKVMKKIFEYAIQGGVIGVDEKAPELINSAGEVADDFIDRFDITPEMKASLRLSMKGLEDLDINSRLARLSTSAMTVSKAYEQQQENDRRVYSSSSSTTHEYGGFVGLRVENMTVQNESDIGLLADRVVNELVNMCKAKGVKI